MRLDRKRSEISETLSKETCWLQWASNSKEDERIDAIQVETFREHRMYGASYRFQPLYSTRLQVLLGGTAWMEHLIDAWSRWPRNSNRRSGRCSSRSAFPQQIE